MNSELTSDLEEIAHLLPSRKSGRDTKLKMSAVKQDWNPQDKFVFQNQIISRSDKINLIARVIEIATRALFQNHAYKFGDEYFHQISGGSIGDRWTGAAAEVVMMDWSKKYQNILENSGIEVLLLSGYVDDGRQLSTSLPMGSRFNPTTRKFEITEQAEAEDKINKINGESTNQRMAKTCLSAMNSINSDLEFTVESPEDFENEQLPTLDFKIWQEQDNTINHCYYQKPVKTPYVIMARSSMATQQKIQILANELTRRISNINMKNSTQEQYNQVVNQFTQELKNSEYQHRTAREIVISGIRGLKTRIFRRESKKQEFYREAHKTAGVRARKKLVSKENWYKTQDNQDPANITATRIARQELPRSLQKGGNKKPKKETESKIKAVMFVPFTPGSELAKLLRENEEKLVKITDSKIKIVERTGIKIQELLTKSNPWKGNDCERENCLLCYTKLRTEKLRTQECHQRNIVYEKRCLNCEEQEHHRIDQLEITEHEKRELKKKIMIYKYIGETSRSSFERGWEHLNDLARLSTSSHMLKHILTEHSDSEIKDVKFGMKILRTCRSSFERQIYESVSIQQERKNHHILNSRAEYNRCSLPRLSTQLGDAENKKYNAELEKEKEQEETLEKKIRMLRKQQNKARLVPVKGENQGTKRRKINKENEYITIKETWGKPDQLPSEKHLTSLEEHPQEPAKKRTRTRNTQYQEEQVRLTNCKTIENKVYEVTEQNSDLEFAEQVDWDQVLKEHKERIEREEQEKNDRLERQRKKIEGWKLFNLCKEFLEQNNKAWMKRRDARIEENNRQERLQKARIKNREILTKQQNKKWEEKLREGFEKLPVREQEKAIEDEKNKNRQELKNAKADLWKLRGSEKRLKETNAVIEIRKLEMKTDQVIKLLEKERTRLKERDKNIRTAIKNDKNKNKKQELLAEVWATYRWITDYLTNTTLEWEKLKEQREQEEKFRLDKWEQQTRKEKIINYKNEKLREQELKEQESRTIVEDLLLEIVDRVLNNYAAKENNREQAQEQDEKLIRTTNTTSKPRILPAKINLSSNKQQDITKYMTVVTNTKQQEKAQPTTSASKLQQTTKNKRTKQKPRTKEEPKIIQQSRGFWKQYAMKQKQEREQQSENKITQQDIRYRTTSVKRNTEKAEKVLHISQISQTGHSQDTEVSKNFVFDASPYQNIPNEVATSNPIVPEHSTIIVDNSESQKSSLIIAGNTQSLPGLEDCYEED